MDVSYQESSEAVGVLSAVGILPAVGVLSADSGQERPTLVEILIDVLQLPNDDLRMTSARLLFDMHKREDILFSSALESYLSQEASNEKCRILERLGSLGDKNRLLVKMHAGNLGSLKPKLRLRLQKLSAACLLEDDPAEPHPSYQGITYSTREMLQ